MDVFLTAKFYDAEGIQIASGNDSASAVSPDRRLRFECVYPDEDPGAVENYELSLDYYEA
jgi:hypothetical protein